MCIEAKMLKLIIEKNWQIFPNTKILLRIYLVLMTTNCTCERSFHKLKLNNDRLRVSIAEERLNNLTRMSAENDLLRSISYSDVIEEFATRKARKVEI